MDKPLVTELAKKIRELYANNQWGRGAHEVKGLWNLLLEKLGEPSLEDILYVLSAIDNPASDKCIGLALRAAPMCGTIESIRFLWPYIPKARRKERSDLLRRAIEFAKDKNEITECLEEFEYL